MRRHVFRDCYAKIDRADEHIYDLSRRIHAFVAAKPYAFRFEPYTEAPGQFVLKSFCDDSAVTRDLETFGILAGEAAHHLRCSLNYLVYRLWRGKRTTSMEFPVFLSAKRYKTASPRKIQLVEPPAAKALINSSQPFNGRRSNDPLWLVHQLDVIDKHRVLVVMSATLLFYKNLGLGRSNPGPPRYLPTRGLKNGTVIVYPAMAPVDLNFEASPEVVLPRLGRMNVEPVVPRLTQASQYVRALIGKFESLP
jgi:hypothetical protein